MNIHYAKWVKSSMRKAHLIAEDSKDQSTKVGCLIVDQEGRPKSWGFNGMPMNVIDGVDIVPERYERPEKYRFTEHAERNAIYLCETSLRDCVLFTTHHPCSGCARGVIQKKISHVYIDVNNGINSEWCRNRDYDDFLSARDMMNEAGIIVSEVALE